MIALDGLAAHRGGGVVDVLGSQAPRSTGRAQDLMLSRALPRVYERWWRPAWSRVLLAPLGGMAGEHRLAHRLLALAPGDRVLDVGCGTGGFTRAFAAAVGEEGLAVGLDPSRTMLERAVAAGGRAAYVRGDATSLPFEDASFDAACCFAALHLMPDPLRALDELARVLAPGGRVAILTSRALGPEPLRAVEDAVARASGMRLFGPDEVTGALRARGFERVVREDAGLAQAVGGRRG